MNLRSSGSILIVSCYELGHQPLGAALPLAFLERAGFAPDALDIAVQDFDEAKVAKAGLVAISVPMHTALRLGVRVAERVQQLNPAAATCVRIVRSRPSMTDGSSSFPSKSSWKTSAGTSARGPGTSHLAIPTS